MEEVQRGVKLGLFDSTPMYRVIRPAGTWERKHIGAMARPGPWEGLLP